MESLSTYIPMDRRQALARGEDLPERAYGSALMADISGFTPLTETLAQELGPHHGAEELTIHLNHVYDALISELHRFGGSVTGFSGDAITCWLDGDNGQRAIACALAMQAAMKPFNRITTPAGGMFTLAMKAAVSTGPVRRFLVGNPQIQVIDVLSGTTLDVLAETEHHAQKGEVIIDQTSAAVLGDWLQIKEWRGDNQSSFGVVDRVLSEIPASPWPPIPLGTLREEEIRPWLLAPVYESLRQGDFLAELRPAVALFLRFGGIDYDQDESAVDKLNEFICKVQRILSSYEGNLIQLTIGDKGSYLYAAFGAPIAHEDETTRAAAVALELVKLSNSQAGFQSVQIGISKGQMRTGAYGSSECRTYGVLGKETNLAARLMQAAAPGQILASKVVFNETAAEFDWQKLADIKVKGKSEPVPVYSLQGQIARRTFRLQESVYRLPMVGRKAELKLIEEKLNLAYLGQGQIIGITGEAGIGKSRLSGEVIRLAYERQMECYGGECQSYGTNTSYLVWREIWEGFFGLQPDWSVEEQLRGLEMQLELIDPSFLERAPLLSAVLNLPIPDNDLTQSLDAKIRKSSLEALLVDCLKARAREAPLFIIIEDTHWLDPLSHDLLEAVARSIGEIPVLLVMVYRPPELDRLRAPRVEHLPYFTEIRLQDFTQEEADDLIRLKVKQLFGPEVAILPSLVKRLVTRAEGNPFYMEELLNYVQDSGIDLNDNRALEQLALPTSLNSLILSRIDQLTESQKITIKVASIIGRLFKAAMLSAAFTQLGSEQKIRTDLDVINRVELTILDSEPEVTYFFKHIITQEVAYESLPFATRAILHEQIALYIEKIYAENLNQFLDLLAFHYNRSENLAKKSEYLLKAGEAAQANYANSAALDYYQRVLPLLPTEKQTSVRFKLGQVLELTGQWKNAVWYYRQGMSEAAERDDCRMVGRCQTAMGELLRKQGIYINAARWLRFAKESFEKIGDEAGIAQALNYTGSLAAQQGEYQKARELYQQSLEIWKKLGERARMASSMSNLGIVARFLGEYQNAISLHEQGLFLRRELGDRWAIAVSLNNLGNVYLDLGDLDGARARLEEAAGLQREIGDKYYIANCINNLGTVIRSQGDYQDSYRMYRESLEIIRDLGDRWMMAYLLEDFGCLACLQGNYQRALRLAGSASHLRDSIHAPLSVVEQAKLDHLLLPARENLTPETQEQAWETGRSAPLPAIFEEVLYHWD